MNPSSQAGWACSVALSAAQAHGVVGPAREVFSPAMGLEADGNARTGGIWLGTKPVTLGSVCVWTPEPGARSGSPPQTQGAPPYRGPQQWSQGCLDSPPCPDPQPAAPQAPSHLWGWVPDAGVPP